MVQELGETSQEMMKADDQAVQDILNRRPSSDYWIVIHHKRIKKKMDTGEEILMRLVKDYNTKPKPLVGTIILEVKAGEIVNSIISPHDAPIDWAAIGSNIGVETKPSIIETPIAGSYLYNT